MLDHLSEGRFRVRHRPGCRQPRDLGLPPRTWRTSRRPARSGRTSSASSPICDGGRTRATRASTGRSRRAASCQNAYSKPHLPCGTPRATPRAGRWPGTAGWRLGFAIGRMSEFDAVRDAYKQAIATAEPVALLNDTSVSACPIRRRGRSRARQQMIAARPNYLTSNVFRLPRHIPHPKGIPVWPR